MTDRLTQIGEKAQGTVRHDDVCWMIDEIERLRELEERTRIFPVRKMERPDLKLLLMELGNRLVTDHGWWTPNPRWQAKDEEDHTGLIAGLTQQINDRPEMRELLGALGFDWPIADEDEIGFYWPIAEEDE